MLSGLTAVARVRGIVTAKLTRLKPTDAFLGVDIVRYEVCAVVVVTIASSVIVIVAAVVITTMA